ncbi:MAG: DUF2752 domain-containing protein [Clostridia bacterium]|nr:DUF2752 domain-containing protein [Clostridia bacterium]
MNPFREKLTISNPKEKLIATAAVAAVIAAMYILDLPCLFMGLFDIPCPGCGITRAYIALFHLDFAAAFAHNPMFWAVPILYVSYLFDDKLFKARWANALLLTLLYGGLFAAWVYKLIAL